MTSGGTASVPYLTPQSNKRRRGHGDNAGDVSFSTVANTVAAAASATAAVLGTQTKQQRAHGLTIPGECQLTYSALHRHRLSRTLKTALSGAPTKLKVINDSGQITVRDGAQEFFEINSIMALSELDDIIGTDWGGSNTAARAACLGGNMELMLTNHSSAVLRCILYVLVPKRDTIVNAPTSVINGFTMMGSDQATAETFGIRPGDSTVYNAAWHAIEAIQFCLSAGQTHIHKHNYDVEQLLDGGAELPTQTYQTRWTVNFCLLVHGVAATSSTGGDTTTTSDGQLNYVWSKKLRWKFFEFSDGTELDVARAIPAAATITSRMYNPDTGAAENVGTGD